MPLPLIYHDDYSPEFPAEHRFPMDKFRLLRDHLIDSGLTRDEDLLRPEICPMTSSRWPTTAAISSAT